MFIFLVLDIVANNLADLQSDIAVRLRFIFEVWPAGCTSCKLECFFFMLEIAANNLLDLQSITAVCLNFFIFEDFC